VPDGRDHESTSIGTLKDLEVWQKSIHLAKDFSSLQEVTQENDVVKLATIGSLLTTHYSRL